ncbi:TolC family protein [Rapidithrix thailandica]|uniref:TolC family protein n=1 Tax=Rapidithrix thailandica TaxID=413964 RepID=A0AAW9RQT7_9BACT
MNLQKYLGFLLIGFTTCQLAFGQDTLQLNRQQCEALFLKENLLLIAEKLNINQAEATLRQARLWPNPTLTIDQVNAWATPAQLQGAEGLPPLVGRFGRNQQIGVEIEQLLLTAGKRKKMMAVEQVSVDMAGQYFEELLRNLKVEFRKDLTQLQYLQQLREVYRKQLSSVQQLVNAYRKQVEEGNLSKAEWLRLKALELEIVQEIHGLSKEMNNIQHELKVLMNLPPSSCLVLDTTGYLPEFAKIKRLAPDSLLQEATTHRPDLKIAQLEKKYFDKWHTYERAQRIPDITLKAGYDRGGNFMKDFVGFGVGIDLPVFNRNQGNIKHARIAMERAEVLGAQKALEMESGLLLANQHLQTAIAFYERLEPGFEAELDRMLNRFTKTFKDRDISQLEYLDFLEAYLNNKKNLLESSKEINLKLEELQYEVGTDIL